MTPSRDEIESTIRATRAALDEAVGRLQHAEAALESAQRVPLRRPIEAVREELAALEGEVESLEPYAQAYQRALASAEAVRGEVAQHRELQARLDRAERRLQEERERVQLLRRVYETMTGLVSG